MLDLKIKKLILKNALSLKKFGLNDFAWRKEDALTLISDLNSKDIGILGGDVYILNTKLEALSDNWACEPQINETIKEFQKRSKYESLMYIKQYPTHPNEKILFSIIFTEQISDL